jgi:type II secretory pathway component PulK
LVDGIAGWADRSYERKGRAGDIPMKQAPFYDISELHMIPGMDDDLYELFAPNLTVSRTPGINVNTLNETTLKALFPAGVKEEIDKFFTDRDSEEADGTFKSEEAFFKYIQGHFKAYEKGNNLEEHRKVLTASNIHFVTDETVFKITVQAQLNQSVRLLEAWVTLLDNTQTANIPSGGTPPPPTNPTTQPANAGLKIHFMRFL